MGTLAEKQASRIKQPEAIDEYYRTGCWPAKPSDRVGCGYNGCISGGVQTASFRSSIQPTADSSGVTSSLRRHHTPILSCRTHPPPPALLVIQVLGPARDFDYSLISYSKISVSPPISIPEPRRNVLLTASLSWFLGM